MANPVKERRYGIINITMVCLEDMPEDLYRMFSERFFSVRSDYDFLREVMSLTCASDLFDPIVEGSEVPEYSVYIERKEDGTTPRFGISVSKVP